MGAKVFIYTLSTCSHCNAAKKFLNSCEIEYDFVDVDLLKGDNRQEVLDAVKEHNPSLSFPTIIIGERVIIGFKEEELREALGL